MVVVGNGTRQGRLGLRQGQRSAPQRRKGGQGRHAQHARDAAHRPHHSAHDRRPLRRRPRDPGAGPAGHRASRPEPACGPFAKRPASTISSPRASARPTRPTWSRPRSRPCKACARCQDVERLRGVTLYMNLHDIHRGIKKNKKRRRVGRGPGSGWGKTSGRGHKGQGQLAGWTSHPAFEGGQMPLSRRVPKRGFNNRWGLVVKVVNVGELEAVVRRRRRGHARSAAGPAPGQGPVRRAESPGQRRADQEAEDFGPPLQRQRPGKDPAGRRRGSRLARTGPGRQEFEEEGGRRKSRTPPDAASAADRRSLG